MSISERHCWPMLEKDDIIDARGANAMWYTRKLGARQTRLRLSSSASPMKPNRMYLDSSPFLAICRW
eukprot:5917943-Amphidinium_carterae.1